MCSSRCRCVTLGSMLILIYLLLLQTIAVQSVVQSVVQNVTRGNRDTFSNPDQNCKSDSCRNYRNIRVGGTSRDLCKCSCNFDNTFVVHNITCVENPKLLLHLISSFPDQKDASFRVTTEESCQSFFKVLQTLDITVPSRRTLCLLGTSITNCNIIKKDSSYFYDGKWYPIWPENKEQDTISITEDDDEIYLQWTSLGKQFTGLIFRLSISCQLKDSSSVNDFYESYLLFKSAGSQYFNGDRPTLGSFSSTPTSSSTTQSSKTQSSKTQSSKTSSPSRQSDKGKNTSNQDHNDKGLIAGLTICAILVILVIVAMVVFFLRRKKRNEMPSSGAKSEANPSYELGQDRSINFSAKEQTPAYDYPDTSTGYQPLVQNTRMRDASGKVPVYTPLSTETKNKQPVVQLITPNKHGLAYETVAVPIQQPTTDNLQESHDYEDPINPTISDEGGLYAVSSAQDDNAIDFENTAYTDPDSVIKTE